MQDSMPGATYQCGAYTIASATRRLSRDGHDIELEAKVLDLILLLLENRERALGKQEVITALWGHRPITDAALSQLIYKARRAFDDDGERQAVIRTIYGRGLQWVAPVDTRAVEPPAAASAASAVEPTAAQAVEAVIEAITALPQPMPDPAATTPAAPRRRHRWLWPATAAVVLAGLLLAWQTIPRSTASASAPPPRLALLPFENATGDTSQDWVQRGLPGLVGSLLDGIRGIEVVDPLRTARIWEYTPAKGTDRAEHTRQVANAGTLIGGRLRKLADLYELSMHVDPGAGRSGADIVLTGADPGRLAVAALPQLRKALKLEPAPAAPLGEGPQDAYLAQTFARGMDAAMHGKWLDARAHFNLVAKGEPDFLPGRYRLGQAQIRTDQSREAQTTLRAVLADAEQRHDPETAANTLEELAFLATVQHAYPEAIRLIERAQPLAERAQAPEIRTWLALDLAKARSQLMQNDGAARALQTAARLIETHRLTSLLPDLHNAELFVANARGDFKAGEAAARAGLAASQAIGNDRGTMASIFNIAYAMENQGRSVEAMPLWVRAWQWGWKQQDYQMQSLAGYRLANSLASTGLDEHGEQVNQVVLDISRKHDDHTMQSLALQLQAGLQWDRGDSVAALRSCRAAIALIDAASDPDRMLGAWTAEAYAALAAEPAALAALVQRADALIAAQPDPSGYRFRQQLLHALRAAAAGDASRARSELHQAATLAISASETIDMRQTALDIALINGDPDTAAIALRSLDLDHTDDVSLLRLTGRWAARQQDAELARKVTQRQASLRTDALRVLQGVDLDAIAAPVGQPDA